MLPENNSGAGGESKEVYLQLEDHLRKHNVFSLYWDKRSPPFIPTASTVSPLVPIFPESSQSTQEFMRFDDDLDKGFIHTVHQQIEVFNSSIPMDICLLLSIPLSSLSLHSDLLNISLVVSDTASLFESILKGKDTSG
jgi:hypothetical protein